MVWGAIIGAAASLAGGLMAKKGAEDQNVASAKAAQKQMDFQERMRGTQYQTAMEDMKKAGLNPILAYKQGGAGTPGGSTYSPVNVGSAGVTGASAASSSATAARAVYMQEKLNAATLGQIHETSSKLFSDRRLNQDLGNKANAETAVQKINARIMLEELKIRRASAASAAGLERFYKSKAGRALQMLDLTGRSINPFASSTSTLRR